MEITKNDETLVAPINPMMPLVPQILANAMPAPVPQMDFNAGIIPNFFHNIKMGQMAKATAREAEIAENKRQYVESSLAMVESIVTFSSKLELSFKKIKHEEVMMAKAEQLVDIQINEGLLKNRILYFQAKSEETDSKMKDKAFEEMYGSPATEDRT
jgi:hypothetical protein